MNTLEKYLDSFSTINLIKDLIYYKDIEGKYICCNKAMLNFLGKTKEEVYGYTDFDLFDETTAKQCFFSDKDIISSKLSKTYNEKILTKDDKTIYFESIKDVIKDEKDKVIGIVGISKDITQRTQLEILHKENQDILEKIINKDDLHTILNAIIKLAESKSSHMFCSILFLDKEEKHLVNGIAPSLPSFYNDAIEGIEIGEGVGSCGTATFRKERVIVEDINTHPFWKPYLELTKKANLHACWSQPIFSKNNSILGTFAMYYKKTRIPSAFDLKMIDSLAHLCGIAIQKTRDEEELEEKKLLLIQQSKMASLGEMLENIAHQWRQPLSLISTGASAIKIQKELGLLNDELVDDAIKIILNSTNHLTKTIDDFKDFFVKSKMQNKFYINDLIKKVLSLTHAKFKNNDINFILDIEKLELFGLENELIHVLINILSNAKDALLSNEIENKYIFITIYKKNDTCVIKIKDNANGIKDNILEKLFEPYFTTKHKSQGTGIGLYMAQEIISKHMNGKIQVRNKIFTYANIPYIGAQFKIILPLNKI